MPTFVALLRGINLGRAKRVAMADLKRIIEDLGHRDVVTYIVSGNAVFTGTGGAASIEKAIEKSIKSELGLEVVMMVRGANDMKKVVAKNPFIKQGADPAALHVAFLKKKPTADAVRAVDPERFAPDELAVDGRTVYLHLPKGYAKANLGNAQVEKLLGVPASTRNWRTVGKLVEMMG